MNVAIGIVLAVVWTCAVVLPFELSATLGNAAFGPAGLVALCVFAVAGWRRRRPAMAGFGGLALLFASTAVARHVGTARPTTASGQEFTVATYNLLFDGGDIGATARLVVDLDADVVFLQEVTPRWADTLGRLASHEQLVPAPGSQGLGILSRFPMSRSRTWTDRGRLVGQCVDVTLPTGTVGACHVHLESPSWAIATSQSVSDRLRGLEANARRRRQQWTRLETEMRESHAPLVIAGDFNTLPSERLLLDARRRWVDATRSRSWVGAAATWPQLAALSHRPPWLQGFLAEGGPWFRIDYVLCDPALDVLDATRWLGGGSDHLPVRVTLALPETLSPSAAATP